MRGGSTAPPDSPGRNDDGRQIHLGNRSLPGTLRARAGGHGWKECSPHHRRRRSRQIALKIMAPTARMQKQILTSNIGVINPASLDDYIARGGYRALEQAVEEMNSPQIIASLQVAGLIGRG